MKIAENSYYAYVIHDLRDIEGIPWPDRFREAIVRYAEDRNIQPTWDLGWILSPDELMAFGLEIEYIGNPLTVEHTDILSIEESEVPF